MVHLVSEWPGSARRIVDSRWANVLILLGYVLLALIMTWPTLARLGTHFAGRQDDMWVHQWNFWWVKQALLSGQNPLYTTLLYYPEGVSLTSHNIPWFNIALWLPLQAIVGHTAAYNLIFIAVFALNGFVMYLFAHKEIRSRPAALIAGLVFGFWPYTMSHSDHTNMMVVFWVPLTLLYLHRTLESHKWRDALIAAVFLAMTGITRWQLLIMSGPIIVGYVLYLLITNPSYRSRRTAGRLLVIGLVAGALMAPLATPVAIDLFAREFPVDVIPDEPRWGSTDLMAYVTPSINNGLWRDKVNDLYDAFKINKLYTPFLGFTTLALALMGVIRRWKDTCLWFLLALVYILLALGPDLAFNGQIFPQIPMPFRLVENWFVVRLLRRPDRLNIFLSLPMAMLAGWGVVALLSLRSVERKGGMVSASLVGLVSLVILIEFAPLPFLTTPLTSPAWYTQIAQDPAEFGTLDLPFDNRGTDKRLMMYQITHGKPLATGHVSRIPRAAFDFIERVPLLKNLRTSGNRTPDPKMVDVSEQLRQLADGNIRYVILHKAYLSDKELASWQEWLIQDPLHEDSDLVAYRTDPILGRDFSLAHEMTTNEDGQIEIGLIRASISLTETVPGEIFQVAAAWASGSAVARHYELCINLVTGNDEVVQSQCQPLASSWPTKGWGANEIVAGDYAFEVSPYANDGLHSVTMTLQDGDSGAFVGNSASVGDLKVIAYPRLFTEPEPSFLAKVTWGDMLALPGYDLASPEDDSLAVTLYWQALRRMDTSYTAFLHLIDPTTGELVAQADVIPRGWSYPTSWWEKGEMVEDTVWLSLDGVPPGDYDLFVGWYDLDSGGRLPAFSDSGEPFAGGSVYLTTVSR